MAFFSYLGSLLFPNDRIFSKSSIWAICLLFSFGFSLAHSFSLALVRHDIGERVCRAFQSYKSWIFQTSSFRSTHPAQPFNFQASNFIGIVHSTHKTLFAKANKCSTGWVRCSLLFKQYCSCVQCGWCACTNEMVNSLVNGTQRNIQQIVKQIKLFSSLSHSVTES